MDVLIPEEIAATNIQWLTERHATVIDDSLWKEPDKLMAAVRNARAIMVRNQTQVTAELLEAAPRLIAVGRLGVGLDNIDVPAASKLGIVVVAPLDANAASVAELTLGLMLGLARKIPWADRSTKAGGWDRKGGMGIELAGRTLAICGFGRIGRLVAQRARAFGMALAVFDPYLQADAPALREAGASVHLRLEEALARADFVTVHLPFSPETRRLFGAEAFAAMKPGSFFINTSRGGVVDEPALRKALQTGRLAGAALDVRENEPPTGRIGLEEMDNVILTPHVGAATMEAQERTFQAVACDIDRLLGGEPAINYINFCSSRR